jgi:hypothetical protein
MRNKKKMRRMRKKNNNFHMMTRALLHQERGRLMR